MHSTRIQALYEEYSGLIEFCRVNRQVSFEMYINDTYKKSLLLSAASYFEATITKLIHDYASKKSKQSTEIVAFIDNKAVKRQYHTFFDWERSNTNSFFGLFGEDFKQKAKKAIHDNGLEEAEQAFLSIGYERNRLVHQNYIEAQLNDTFEEIYKKYEIACRFIDLINQLFSD